MAATSLVGQPPVGDSSMAKALVVATAFPVPNRRNCVEQPHVSGLGIFRTSGLLPNGGIQRIAIYS